MHSSFRGHEQVIEFSLNLVHFDNILLSPFILGWSQDDKMSTRIMNSDDNVWPGHKDLKQPEPFFLHQALEYNIFPINFSLLCRYSLGLSRTLHREECVRTLRAYAKEATHVSLGMIYSVDQNQWSKSTLNMLPMPKEPMNPLWGKIHSFLEAPWFSLLLITDPDLEP